MIDEAIRRGDIKFAPASEKHVKMANDVQNDFYNKLIGLGMNEQEALSASILMKNFALKRTVSPEHFKDWYDKIVVTNKPQSQVGAVMQNALHQSAMYKSPKQNFSDFYNQVFEKEKDAKENNTNLKKSYFEYNDENTNIRVPHDTIVHDNNKHNLSSSEWETLFNNLTNPSSAVLSNKPRFNGTPVLLKYNIANKSYGVVVEFFKNKKPIITTAFTDKEKNINNWLKKNSHSQAKNTSSVTTKGMLLSNDYNNIINYVKEKLNPNVNNHEEGIYVNGKFIDFDWLEEKLYALNKLAKNLRPEGELQENYDGWTVSYKNDKNAKERKHLYNLKNKLIDNKGTFDKNNPNIYHQKEIKNFDDMLVEFSNDIEKTPDDYKINNLNEALKDLKISEDKPKEIKTPFETIQVRARNIEHIIDRKDDKARYKSINKMFATLERPNIIIKREDDSRGYFKIFENNNKNKKQIVYVSTDKLGNFVLTTIPVKRNKKFIDAINQGNIIYDSRKGVINNSPDNTIITDSSDNFNPDNKSFQSAHGAIEETIQDKFGCSVEELTENIKQDIINTLSDYDVSDSEFSIQEIKLYGSYSKGTNKETSDLDFIVQYDGSMREDSAFNILHDVEHTIEDKDGNKVLIDINPINVNESGTIDEHVEYMNSLDDDNNTYFQSAYHGTPHKFDEFSLDAIGTGEGAQAHGWGLYFAGNKDVSENYRRNLTQSVEDIIYNGKKLDINSNEYETISAIWNFFDAQNDTFEKAQKAYIENYKRYAQSDNETIREFAEKKIRVAENIDYKKIKYNGKGQLFEVDIPDTAELLDEDKELIHQPDKVQRVIEKIYVDAMKSNNVELTNAIGITGKEIYRGFSKYFGSDKKASEFLNSYGIKGITYDSRQDGRCYVIFDDKAVNVIKTYYQSMLSGIDKDQKVNVLDLTSAFGSDANLSKKDLTNYIKSLIGSNPISTSDKKAIVNFIARSKRTGKGNVYIPSHIANSSKVETNNKGVRNTVVNNIVDLIKNSVLIDKSENRDKQTKPNVDYYYRCYVPVRVNNDIYTVRITLENNEKDNLFNIINGNVYDVIIDKKMTSAHSMTNSQSSLMKSSSNSNIPQNNKNITSDQITIEDMLKDVLDAEGNTYYQSDSEDVIREKLSNENIQNKIDELSQRIEKLAEEESELDNSLLI